VIALDSELWLELGPIVSSAEDKKINQRASIARIFPQSLHIQIFTCWMLLPTFLSSICAAIGLLQHSGLFFAMALCSLMPHF
jgi:hypothetical protein